MRPNLSESLIHGGRLAWEEIYDKGVEAVFDTVCKTWRCLVCREKKKALVSMIAEYGLSMRQPCYFTTLTLTWEGVPHDATYVTAVWRKYLRQNREWHGEWMKVIELTAKGQPHLHLLWGPGPMRSGPLDTDGRYLDWTTNSTHQRIEKAWRAATDGRSYITRTRLVRSASNAAWYVSKYVAKAKEQQALRALGFARLWSKSNGWAPGYQTQMALTSQGVKWVPDWHPIRRTAYEQMEEATIRSRNPALRSVGTDFALAFGQRRARRRDHKRIDSLRRSFIAIPNTGGH